MTKLKVILPVLLAVCVALGGAVWTYRWVNSQIAPSPKEVQMSEAVPIAVALLDLPWGTQVTSSQIKLVPFLKDSLPPGHFQDSAALEGRVLVFPMKADEPILESRLAPTSIQTGGVAAVVKPGKRAVAVKGDKVIGLSGLIRPGNRVDVLVTLEDPGKKSEVTKLVLQDVPVLATGEELTKNGDGKTSPVDVYTLEVTPEEAEKLSLAAAEGKLQFALRNATDMETVLTNGATIPQTLASYRPVPKRSEPAAGKPVARKPVSSDSFVSKVQVIKGNKVSQETFYQ
jgi:pilus assembly protein CpaB